MNFLSAAIQILKKANTPLHYREIAKRSLEEKLIDTGGKTPWATMNAKISTDIIRKGESSDFVRMEPGVYGLKNLKVSAKEKIAVSERGAKIIGAKHLISTGLTSRQKGDIGELRVAELITLYGDEALSCYRPMADDEGIDIIVKKRGSDNTVFVQVKTTYGYSFDTKKRRFVSTIEERKILNSKKMLMVFTYFDLSDGDLFEHVYVIPANKFLELTINDRRGNNNKTRVFSAGFSKPSKKFAEFMIEKRELANKIIELMS